MTFLEKCINESIDIWEECLNGDFLKGLANGTLPEECFKGYIVEDSLYLREYSRVFAWGILKADTMEEIRNYHSMLSFVNEGENSTRLYYLKRYGLMDKEVQKLPLRAENEAYTKTMIKAAKEGGVAECMMATLPCMLSYRWLFKELLKRNPQVKETVYSKFVEDYEGEQYSKICDEWIAFTEQICQTLSAEDQASCLAIFKACSKHELRFWEMSARPRKDI